jgi:hypothetical protein
MGLFDQIISGALRGAMGQGGASESSLLPGLLGQLLGRPTSAELVGCWRNCSRAASATR